MPFPISIEWDDQNITPNEDFFPAEPMDWLTPIHWAICAASRAPDARIRIRLDDPAVFETNPLLKLIRNLSPSCRPWLVLEPEDSTRSDERLGEPIKAEQLRDILRAEFTSDQQAKTRHAIQNLILPLILNGEAQQSDEQEALQVLLVNLGLTQASEGSDSRAKSQLSGPPSTIHVVDDQARHGWLAWVRSVVVPPDDVVDLKPKAFWKRLLNSVARAADSRVSRTWKGIFLLDLRLGAPFFQKLIPDFLGNADRWLERAKAIDRSIYENLKNDHNLIRKYLKSHERGGKQLIDEAVVLTLTTRLFALAHPRTPIILFSSTRDHRNLSPLKPFANILTDFSKGSVSQADNNLDFADDTAESLRRSISRAKQMIHISDVADSCNQFGAIGQNKVAAHVELYLDESRKNPMTVGGVVSVFVGKTPDLAQNKAHQYNQICLKDYFSAFDFGDDIQPKKMNGQQRAETFRQSWSRGASCASCAPVCVSRIGLQGNAEQSDLVCRVVEIFVSSVLPSLRSRGVMVSNSRGTKDQISIGDMTFSVFLPSRSIPADEAPDRRGREWPYRFGTGSDVKEIWVREGKSRVLREMLFLYLTSDILARGVVDDALVRYAPQYFRDKCQHAWTVRLAYVKDYEDHLPKHRRHPPAYVRFAVHHKKKERTMMEKHEVVRRQQATELARTGWQPDSRALHYLADLVVGVDGGFFQETESWSCWDTDLDDAERFLKLCS